MLMFVAGTMTKCFLMGGGVRHLAEIPPHMRTVGIIPLPKAAILVVSATDRELWPDQKIWGREWYYMKLGWCCVVKMT